jgi:ubiquinone/menaquinone biosynthesis C-methylase UbiE
MQEADRQLSAYYAARAAEYERIYDKPERQDDLARLRELVPKCLAGRNVLELACGTGYWTQFIARTAVSVTAIDINEETLAIARSKTLPPGRVTFEQGDVKSLSARHSTYTGSFAGFWWSHMPSRERRHFVESLHRALTPGAIVVALDNRYVEGSSTPISHTDSDGNSYQLRALGDGTQHTVLKNFPTEAELRSDVHGRAKAVEYTALEYYWVFKYEVVA